MKTTSFETPSTSAPIQAGANAGSEFIRLDQLEKIFGLKRGIAYRLISEGRIKSVNLRKKGAKTGLRLVYATSVREYLLALTAEESK